MKRNVLTFHSKVLTDGLEEQSDPWSDASAAEYFKDLDSPSVSAGRREDGLIFQTEIRGEREGESTLHNT